jgi:predicted metal-dependent hydrolase
MNGFFASMVALRSGMASVMAISSVLERLSSALAPFPDWVVDYVIVHELAHLDVPAHNAAFWTLVHRYPRTERAIGYLTAKGGEVDDPG